MGFSVWYSVHHRAKGWPLEGEGKASLITGPCGEVRTCSTTLSAPLTAMVSSRTLKSTQAPWCQMRLGFFGSTVSATKSVSSFWNMVRLQPKSRLWPSKAIGLRAKKWPYNSKPGLLRWASYQTAGTE